MSNINETSVVFTKSGLLKLDFKDNNECILLEEMKPKFDNKMGFLIYLFDFQVELEDGITFNQVLQNLKFFEKELEILFSETKMPKNNFAAQKLFEILNSLNKENSNFLDIWNEEKKLLENSLLKNNLSENKLKILKEKKEFYRDEVLITIKKIVSERKTFIFKNEDNIKEVDKKIFLITKSKIYKNDEQVELSEIHPILLLSSKISIDYSSEVNYVMSFEELLKCLFKDFWIFRSKEEIKYWKEEINKYYPFYTKNVIYLSEFKNLLKGESRVFKNFNKGEPRKGKIMNKESSEQNMDKNNVVLISSYRTISQDKKIGESKPKASFHTQQSTRFNPRYITQEEVNKMMKMIEEKPEMMRLFSLGLDNKNNENLVEEKKLKVVSNNTNIKSQKSNANLKRIK